MRDRTRKKAAGTAIVSGLAVIWLVPIVMMLVVSFMPPDQRAPKFGGLLINSVSFANYQTIFNDAPIGRLPRWLADHWHQHAQLHLSG